MVKGQHLVRLAGGNSLVLIYYERKVPLDGWDKWQVLI
jgi:hypothetical protein